MRFKFDANQDFQVSAIEAVVNLFDGQPNASLLPPLFVGGNPPEAGESLAFAAVGNRLVLDESGLLDNLKKVQEANELPQDSALQLIEETTKTFAGEQTVRFPNFSVEMETGT